MKKALFAALASVAFLGASCSVQDFSTVVMDKPTITASFPDAPKAAIGEQDLTKYYGKYSFRYGYLSSNLVNYDLFVPGYEMNGATGQIIPNSYSYRSTEAYTPCKPNTTYSKSYTTGSYGDSFNVYCYDSSFNHISRVATYSDATFVTPSNAAYFRFEAVVGAFKFMLNEGSTLLPYQDFAYGFSFDTPVTGAGSCVMDMYWNNGEFLPRSFHLAYNYNDECILYTESYKFDFGGNSDLQQRFLAEWNGAFASGINRGFDVFDTDYDDDYLVLVPYVLDYSQGAFCEFYIHDRYEAGFEDASNLLYGGIFKDARYVTLTYTKTGGAFASVDYDGFTEAFAAFRPYMYNGLLGVNEWLYNDRGGTLLPDWDGSSDVGLIIQYTGEVSVTASPLYVDVQVFTDAPASGSCSTFTPRLANGTTPMSLTFDRSFKGLVTDYYSYDSRYNVFKGYSFSFPAQAPVCQTNYVGVLSNYAAGYLDGVNSRNAEIADLSQRIIDLQSDLSGYDGMTYDQIYELGRQAGLNAGNAANSMMSGLFGAILSVPLSIFGGLGEFSVLGVSVMSLIISLLVVAVAVMVLKRFL